MLGPRKDKKKISKKKKKKKKERKKKKKKAAKTLGLETLSETTPKTTLRKVTAINFLVNMHLVYFAIVGTGA